MDEGLQEWKRQRCEAFFARLAEIAFEMLPEFFPDSDQKGKRWESDFRSMCMERNLPVEPPSGREDLVVAGMRVQCKNVDESRNGTIDISNMRPVKANGGLRGYHSGEVDVFAIRHRGEVFIVPAVSVMGTDGVVRKRVRLQSLVPFANNWGVFSNDYRPLPQVVQRPLF